MVLTTNNLIGLGASAEVPLVVSAVDNASNTSNLTTYTFSSVNFGAAASNRYIVVVFAGTTSSTGRTLSSVTIGGISATVLVSLETEGAGFARWSAIAIAAVPTGTSGDVVITWSGAFDQQFIAAYRLTGLRSTTAVATASSAADPASLNVNVDQGGAIIAVAHSNDNLVASPWTGVTGDVSLTAETRFFDTAFAQALDAETPRTVEADYDSSASERTACAVSLR